MINKCVHSIHYITVINWTYLFALLGNINKIFDFVCSHTLLSVDIMI